jgi:hypothetical protein
MAMREAKRQIDRRPGAWLGTAVLCLLVAEAGQADDEKSKAVKPTDLPQSLVATSSAGRPLNLLLTRAELESIVRNYQPGTGEALSGPIDDDEVLVIAPTEHAPMRDVSQDVGEGIVAPFWAIMHPKDAWRIFVPIPPKGRSMEAERPAPDPR